MITNTTTTAMTILTAEELFRIIKGFPRVWFSLISTNPYVCYEFPIPSEEVSFDHDNGQPTICSGANLETKPFVALSCDTYQCKVTFQDNDIVNLDATPLASGDNKYPDISISVSQYF